MKVIVIGDGKVGRTIVGHICNEGHEVVVIDKNPNNVDEIVSLYDVMGLCGNGASYDVLKDSGADKADLLIAVTSSDETNILAWLIAQKLGAKSTIARVRNVEYSNQTNIFRKDLGIKMTINPEKESANEILKIINFPEAIKVDSFANRKVDLVEKYIPEDSPLVGQSLASLYQKYQIKVLVCAGSTAGGIKMSRIILLTKSSSKKVKNMVSPRKVETICMDGKPANDATIEGVQSFTIVYFIILVVCAILISIDNYDIVTNITASLACISNVGPGLSAVGPAGTFKGFSSFSKFILSLEMIAGRLELFPLLVLFNPKTWKKRI